VFIKNVTIVLQRIGVKVMAVKVGGEGDVGVAV
jgi:hypothetical protein